MGWIENIDSGMIVTCGDGRKFYPLWIRATVEKDFNVAQYEFMEVAGTLVRKYKPKGKLYEIKICFHGDNHLDTAESFDRSSNDERPWNIQHPLYGSITVQPLKLKRDDTSINVTEFSGPFVETITEENPQVNISKPAKVIADKAQLDDLLANYFVGRLVPSTTVVSSITPPTAVVSVQRRNISQIYNAVSKRVKGATDSVKDVLDADEYFNAFHKANSAVLQITSFPLEASRAVIALINAPFQFKNSVLSRIGSLTASFDMIRQSIEGLTESGVVLATEVVARKLIYETNGAMVISSMATASILQYDQANNELTDSPTVDGSNLVTPDYPSRTAVISVMETLLDTYNTYLEDLDSLQTDNGGEEDSFIPDPTNAQALAALINFTVAELMSIVLTGRQERVITLKDDTNLISLAHKLYGLDQEDSSIEQLMETNKIGINELMKLSKGRQIVYYV